MQQDTFLPYSYFQFIDLSLLNETGKDKLITFYKELLLKFPQKMENDESELYVEFKELTYYNQQHPTKINKDINLSNLADEINEMVF